MKKVNRGMTLLEVMLALVILATAGLAVMKSASESLNNQAYLQDKTFALWAASNYLVELKLQKKWPSSSWQSDTQELADCTWYIRYQGVQTGDSNFIALDIEASEKLDGPVLADIRTYLAK
ncbi:type II secretion system minor pseudopilin GspI [Psychromonas sp. MME2]|uniref:type II secretion system minor pseudopilin GspI n=1 Tax=unclassified Psychromonas TaxID=2614957 RepID=UPI00339C210F